jgi:general secretion pathway protein E
LVNDEKIKYPKEVYIGRGCRECKNTGYYGRVCIYEVIPYTSKIKIAVNDDVSLEKLKQLTQGDYVPMRLNGARKVLEGVTSIEEVLRVAV